MTLFLTWSHLRRLAAYSPWLFFSHAALWTVMNFSELLPGLIAKAIFDVLGCDAKGRPIGEPDEIPSECGVLIAQEGRLVVARSAVHRALPRLPFAVWLALAKAQPVAGFDEESQDLLGGFED